jgi:hypothetical protein
VERRRAAGGGHPALGPISPWLEQDYKTALQMAEAAQTEGREQAGVHTATVTSLDLENEFSFVSKRFLKADLYSHAAYLFDCFDARQKRHLYYNILWRMTREYTRRKRRSIASGLVEQWSVQELLDNRTRGTYRVEQDTQVSR